MDYNTSFPLPETGFVRLFQIIGNPKATPPIPAIIPVSKTTWFKGVREGRYPKPSKKFGPRISAYHVDDIRKFIASAVEVTP